MGTFYSFGFQNLQFFVSVPVLVFYKFAHFCSKTKSFPQFSVRKSTFSIVCKLDLNFSLVHNFIRNEKKLNGETTERKDVRAKNIIFLVFQLCGGKTERKHKFEAREMVQTLIDGHIYFDAFYTFIIKIKVIFIEFAITSIRCRFPLASLDKVY